jgi:hypothetical protein
MVPGERYGVRQGRVLPCGLRYVKILVFIWASLWAIAYSKREVRTEFHESYLHGLIFAEIHAK